MYFSDDHNALRDLVRRVVDKEINPNMDRWEEDEAMADYYVLGTEENAEHCSVWDLPENVPDVSAPALGLTFVPGLGRGPVENPAVQDLLGVFIDERLFLREPEPTMV